jgi:ferrous iron transport protein A
VRPDPSRLASIFEGGLPVPLGQASPGFRGTIRAIDANAVHSSLPAEELERRLLEIGLVEGARVEVRHQGLIRRDPIAVRVNGHATFALRRREAAAVLVVADAPAA